MTVTLMFGTKIIIQDIEHLSQLPQLILCIVLPLVSEVE